MGRGRTDRQAGESRNSDNEWKVRSCRNEEERKKREDEREGAGGIELVKTPEVTQSLSPCHHKCRGLNFLSQI